MEVGAGIKVKQREESPVRSSPLDSKPEVTPGKAHVKRLPTRSRNSHSIATPFITPSGLFIELPEIE